VVKKKFVFLLLNCYCFSLGIWLVERHLKRMFVTRLTGAVLSRFLIFHSFFFVVVATTSPPSFHATDGSSVGWKEEALTRFVN
jgi:hypothetical protein